MSYKLAFSDGKLLFKDGVLGMTTAGDTGDFCYCCSCPPTNDCSPQTCSNGKNIALPKWLKVSMSGIVVQSCVWDFPDWSSINSGCECPRASGAGTCGASYQWQNTDLDFSNLNPLDTSPCNYSISVPASTPGTITMAMGDKCCSIQDEGFAAVGWGWLAQYNAATQLLTAIVVGGTDSWIISGTIQRIPCFFAGTATVPCGTWKSTDTITIANTISPGQEITSGYILAGGGNELWCMASGGTNTIQCLKSNPG